MSFERALLFATLVFAPLFTDCADYALSDFSHSPDPELPAYYPMPILEGYGTTAINLGRTRRQIEQYAGNPMEETPFSTSYVVKIFAESVYVRIIWDDDTQLPTSIAFRSGLSVVVYTDSNGVQKRRPGIHFGATKRTVDSAYAGLRKMSDETDMSWAFSGLGIAYGFNPDESINFIMVTEP